MPTDSSLPFQSNKSEQTSYYDLLQVSQKADPEIIEAAYRRLALKFHPDHNADPQATGQMQALNEAYNVLKDATRRAEYDRELKRAFFTDDLTDDDYEYPARRRSIRAGWAERLSGLAVVGGLALVLFLWLAGRDSNATDKTDPTAVQSPRPTVALPPGTLLADDFESVGSANWRLDQPWHLTTRYAHSGKNSLWFGDEGRGHYGPNVSAAATLVRPLALGEGQPILNFWLSGQSDRDEMPTGEGPSVRGSGPARPGFSDDLYRQRIVFELARNFARSQPVEGSGDLVPLPVQQWRTQQRRGF